ncbi:uncharacterized protein EV154DRAFT_424671 [Mucor mucedo]|uniref:uncharacterized protein n=1 Tax=Mucor mucedo TaxID=29922 RepID=UPI00221E8DFC|nr:uncharacterized protein EV154DRAFT_424671 [Mucor mucedo]KAI7889009.1 hypothetical protein EV154DRAFT_424671 [Mucor mucedo]
MFGVTPLPPNEDPLLNFGRALGFERLIKMPFLHAEAVRVSKQVNPPAPTIDFLPGTFVLKRAMNKVNKMCSNWEDVVYRVVTSFSNNTYVLVNAQTGALLKNRVNGIHLKKYFLSEENV